MLTEKQGIANPHFGKCKDRLIRAYRAEIAKLDQHLERFESKGMRVGEPQAWRPLG